MPRNYLPKSTIKPDSSFGKLSFKLFGQWDESIRILNKLSKEIKECSLKAQLKICQKVRDEVKMHLVNQDLGWVPLTEKYAKRKSKAGLDGRTLISHAEYYDAISAWQVGNRHLVMVGVKNGIYTKDLNGKRSKLTIAQIATIHEFANGKKFPRRPLWNPTLQEMGGKKGLEALFLKHFKATLRRNGIPIKNLNLNSL